MEMVTTDSFNFVPISGTSRMDLMDQAGAANDRMYVMGRYPDLTQAGDTAFDGTQVGSEGYLAADDGLLVE